MTSIGKRGSEPKAGLPGQEVLWLATSAPPAQFVTFLRSRGLCLVPRAEASGLAPLRLLLIEPSGPPAARAPNLTGRRIAVMHPDPGNADALAQSLRAKGAEVVALSLNPESLQRVETLDPDAVIMEASDFCSSCWEIVRALWQHPRLRFATIVLATPELMGSQQVSAFDVHDLSFAVNEVAKEYERIADDARNLDRFSFELSSLGPSRSLRALLAAGRSMRLSISAPEASIEVDLAEQIIVGAQSPIGAAPGEGLLGVHALNLLLMQRAGRVEVRRVDHPAHTNVMAPLDAALHMARDASSGLRPSGLHRPIVANHAPAPSETSTAKSKKKSHDQTLIGVPVVQLGGLAPATKTKPGLVRPSNPPTQKPRPSAPPRSLKPPASPASLPEAPTLPPARPQPAVPAASAMTAPTKPPATKPYAATMQAMVPPPPPVAPMQVASPVAPAASDLPAAALEAPILIAPEFEQPVPVPSVRPSMKASALDTVRMEALDAEAVRAFRSRSAFRLPKNARWVALALPIFLVAFWLVSRGKSPEPGAAAPAPASQLVPHARAAEPPTPVAPVPLAAAAPEPVAVVEREAAEPAVVGHQNRGNARKASLLSNQANAFRRKKMFPTARVRYLEALKVYPDFPRALSGLVQLGLNGGDASEALRYAKQLVKARPGQAPYQLLLGDAYRATGDEKEARASYQSAARLGSTTASERLPK